MCTTLTLKTEGVNRTKGGRGHIQKTIKKMPGISQKLTLISLKKFIKCYNAGDFPRHRQYIYSRGEEGFTSYARMLLFPMSQYHNTDA